MFIPRGYQFSGVASGVKPSGKPDLALITSSAQASGVGVFTTNRVCAAPVQSCRRRLPADDIKGIVVNSGNANACTGAQGQADAEQMTAMLAAQVGCSAEQVLVCSTGVIGRPLPMDNITSGINDAYGKLGSTHDAAEAAAQAILTTDTRTKIASREIAISTGTIRVLGFAKGAAMIGPSMATMLAFVLTDAKVPATSLEPMLRTAVDRSFHCISVEGHTSTNDTVLLLANGASGSVVETADGPTLAQAVAEVCSDLARAIAEDAEGASHLITIDVTGTRTGAEARAIAKTVADSALVKTAIYGNDPNWGRICSAAGYAGVAFGEADLSLRVNGTLLYDQGTPMPIDEQAESQRMSENRDTHIELIFTLGSAGCRFWTCDLTREYVHINADYTT